MVTLPKGVSMNERSGEGERMDKIGADVRLFLVDDHAVVRQELRLLLEQDGGLVCGEAADIAEAMAAIPASRADLVMVDLSLGQESGLDLLRDLAAIGLKAPRLVYSIHEDPFHVAQAFALGASGYVTKREVPETLKQAIRELMAGRRYASPRAARAMERDPRLGNMEPVVR